MSNGDILEDIKNALVKISSSAYKGLQMTKKESMIAYYNGQLAVISFIGYILQNGEHTEVKDEK